MKVSPSVEIAAHMDGARGLERILLLEQKLARVPVISRQHRQLTKAIEIAAAAYRITLDNEQASAAHGPSDRATARHFPRRKHLRSKGIHS
jgi:hypothetical protein